MSVKPEILPLLENWHRIHEALTAADDQLDALMGRSPESPLFEAMWGAFGAYTETLETLLIGSPDNRWLEWYQFECQMGERPMQVVITEGEPARAIGTLVDLAEFLEACR